jgi:hypothetical protein
MSGMKFDYFIKYKRVVMDAIMTIPVKNNFSSELSGRLSSLGERQGKVPEGNDGNGRNAFARLFVDAIKRGEAGDGGTQVSPTDPVAPDKEQIQKLIMKVQIQMYEHLLGVMGNGSAESSPGLLTDGENRMVERFLTPETLMSKNRHQEQKSDGSPTEARFAPIIERAARTYGVDSGLIRGVIKAESGFNHRAVSPKGAAGLMQLMPATAKELGVSDPYDPVENIMGGTRYLKGLLDRYGGNVALSLAAYNWGMGNVEKSPGRLPAETSSYIARVTRYYREAKA